MADIEKDKAWMARRSAVAAAAEWVALMQLCKHLGNPETCFYCNDPRAPTPVYGEMPEYMRGHANDLAD